MLYLFILFVCFFPYIVKISNLQHNYNYIVFIFIPIFLFTSINIHISNLLRNLYTLICHAIFKFLIFLRFVFAFLTFLTVIIVHLRDFLFFYFQLLDYLFKQNKMLLFLYLVLFFSKPSTVSNVSSPVSCGY